MSIELHCPQCNKLIRAPDSAGGRHGKCPYCKHEVYVPMPEGEVEPLAIAPVDEDTERRAQEAEEEAREIAVQLRREKDVAPEKPGASGGGAPPPSASAVDVAPLVVRFVKCMQGSNLDEADRVARKLKGAPDRTREEVQRLMVDELQAPGLEDVPPGLYKGFLKALLDRL